MKRKYFENCYESKHICKVVPIIGTINIKFYIYALKLMQYKQR